MSNFKIGTPTMDDATMNNVARNDAMISGFFKEGVSGTVVASAIAVSTLVAEMAGVNVKEYVNQYVRPEVAISLFSALPSIGAISGLAIGAVKGYFHHDNVELGRGSSRTQTNEISQPTI